MKIYIYLIFYLISVNCYKITTKPNCNTFKYKGNFFWKIGKSRKYKKGHLHRTLFNDYPICIYRDKNSKINAISDICIHRGASLSSGKLLNNNCVQCPYHGWEYEKGLVKCIPGSPIIKGEFGVPLFKIHEENGDVYLCPTYDINSKNGIKANNSIYIPPEAHDESFVRISGTKQIHRPNQLITENVLDMMHISYVHTFGNQVSPVPFEIKYEDIDEFSGKTTFHYTAGPTSMSSLLGQSKYVKVENEFYLPDTTVTRVFAGSIIKTIVTHCYPIGKNESILHYDLYRNFLQQPLFNGLFYKQMDITLKEDVDILNNIYDNYIKGFMNTKFDITQLKYREKWNKQFLSEKKDKQD
mgnify:FL=1|tara:strand:- start:2543 stop:3607 length:1065 start_codon:yes stop_codon:yes gene_type:complete